MITIETTGLDQYAPGGNANVQCMVIGGPGAGKTRWSSYFPAPIYANCENGLASIADRQMPFATIKDSKDMLEFLELLERECRKPRRDRRWDTVVIDTLDAYQRKVKDEWLRNHPGASAFSGYDAWGFLDAKMQLLMTRLLNLDMNVLVLVHYSDKTFTEGTGENKVERHEYVLQLKGALKDEAFNDFDLVGWMGTFWELDENGQRAQKRGLTFKPTPDKPFLKDRLNVTPTFLEVRFAERDYTELFTAVLSRLDELPASTVVEEVGSPEGEVVPPGDVEGPVDGRDPAKQDLNDFKKPELVKIAQELEIKFPGNILKAELIALIEKTRAERAAAEEAPEPQAEVAAPEPTSGDPEVAVVAEAEADVEVAVTPDEQREAAEAAAKAGESHEPTPEASEDVQAAVAASPVIAQAVSAITEQLGATEVATEPVPGEEVVDLTPQAAPEPQPEPEPVAATPPPPPAPEPAPAAPAAGGPVCEECGVDVSKDSFAQLSQIKFKRTLCQEDYRKARSA